MKKIGNSLLTILIVFTILGTSYHVVQAAEAWSWIGPVEVLKDNFTTYGGSFGFTYSLDAGDCCCGGPAIEDTYPERIRIDKEGNLIIGDWDAKQIHVFSKAGARLSIIKRDPSVKCNSSIIWPGTVYVGENTIIAKRGSCAEAYDYKGKLLWTMQPHDNIYPVIIDVFPSKIVFKDLLKSVNYASDDKKELATGYSIYDMKGTKIGHVDEYTASDKIDNNNVREGSITYSNVYEINEGFSHWVQFGHDDDKHLYIARLEKIPDGFSENISQFPSGKVDIYNTNGNRVYTLLLPQNEYSKNKRTCGGPEGSAFAGRDVINEYAKGFAVSNTGDIYTTLYVPHQLKIIKWLRIDLDKPIPVAILSKLSKSSLRILRNELIARKGRIFTSKDLREIFETQPWYKPKSNYTDNDLSNVDRDNIVAITQIESSVRQ